MDIKEKYPGYDFYILMVGRLAREKNYGLALEVMREVVKNFNALLVIVGEGPERAELKSQINVKLEGFVENPSGYYRSADIFLLTSNYEGYGLVVIEALQNGLPVIMSDVGVAGEIVKNGENGVIAPVGDKAKFLEAITRVKNDKEFLARLRENAKNTKLPYTSFEDYREKLINSWRTCA